MTKNNPNPEQKKKYTIAVVLIYLFYFTLLFSGTYFVLWFNSFYKVPKHCHLLCPPPSSIPDFPSFNTFYKKNKLKFNIAFRHESKPNSLNLPSGCPLCCLL
jgi:hypothetical protein